jgi:hypothetical protein
VDVATILRGCFYSPLGIYTHINNGLHISGIFVSEFCHGPELGWAPRGGYLLTDRPDVGPFGSFDIDPRFQSFWHLPFRYLLVVARLRVVIGVCKLASLKDNRLRHEPIKPIAMSARQIGFLIT